MKSISLYVDKWYISGAVNFDGVVKPLSLSNGDDRFWLYFFEDTLNNRVNFGKNYEDGFRNGEIHYISDVFSKINEEGQTFTRFDSRKEELKDIFYVSGIFDTLHSAAEQENALDVYLSFSADISAPARLTFINELKEHEFVVKESVARLPQLALEESAQSGKFKDEGHYLVLEATNENLHYYLFNRAGDIFLFESEDTIPGNGLDVRKRALVERVVEILNSPNRFLSTQEEKDFEYLRFEKMADDWLRRIASRPNHIPVSLGELSLSKAPNNPQSVTIKPWQLDERTNAIVDDIVRKIAEFIKESGLRTHLINGVILIGNTFTNKQFKQGIYNKIILDENKIALYRDIDIPKIVSVYSRIDCSQFSEATSRFTKNAEAEQQRIKLAREEEAKRKRAEEEAQAQAQVKAAKEEAERAYASAIENIDKYEKDKDYENMKEWAEIALTNKPDDAFAKECLERAQNKLAEERANAKSYNDSLRRAKSALEDGNWTEAIQEAKVALRYKPGSRDAQNILDSASKKVDSIEKINRYITRSDTFATQGLLAKALEELDKVFSLEPNNKDAIKRRDSLQKRLDQQATEIERYSAKLDKLDKENRHDDAIEVCEKLIEIDAANLQKWVAKREVLKLRQKDYASIKSQLSSLKKQIDDADFNDDWPTLMQLCDKYLTIKEDDNIRRLYDKAKERDSKAKVKAELDNAINRIKALMADDKLDEAEDVLDQYQRMYQSHPELKELRKQLFNKRDGAPSKRPVGFVSAPTPKSPSEDDFFGTPSKPTTQQRHKTSGHPRNNSKTDEFNF